MNHQCSLLWRSTALWWAEDNSSASEVLICVEGCVPMGWLTTQVLRSTAPFQSYAPVCALTCVEETSARNSCFCPSVLQELRTFGSMKELLEEVRQHEGAPCTQWLGCNGDSRRAVPSASWSCRRWAMHVLSAWLRRDHTVPQATSSGPTRMFLLVFLFCSCSFKWKWLISSKGRWWRTTYLRPFHSWPEPVQEMQVIYLRPLTSTEDGLPAQHRGMRCFFLLWFPLLFHSFLLLRFSKFLSKGHHVSLKLLIPLIPNKVLCPFRCKCFSGCLCSLTTSFLVNNLHTRSVATTASELNVVENHINIISVVMKSIQYTP